MGLHGQVGGSLGIPSVYFGHVETSRAEARLAFPSPAECLGNWFARARQAPQAILSCTTARGAALRDGTTGRSGLNGGAGLGLQVRWPVSKSGSRLPLVRRVITIKRLSSNPAAVQKGTYSALPH